MSSGLFNLILFSVTEVCTEFEVLLKDIRFLIPFELFFKSLNCLLLFSKINKRFMYCLYLKWAEFPKLVSLSFKFLSST